jgi:cobalamin biosynthesis Mg chelatase CobN
VSISIFHVLFDVVDVNRSTVKVLTEDDSLFSKKTVPLVESAEAAPAGGAQKKNPNKVRDNGTEALKAFNAKVAEAGGRKAWNAQQRLLKQKAEKVALEAMGGLCLDHPSDTDTDTKAKAGKSSAPAAATSSGGKSSGAAAASSSGAKKSSAAAATLGALRKTMAPPITSHCSTSHHIKHHTTSNVSTSDRTNSIQSISHYLGFCGRLLSCVLLCCGGFSYVMLMFSDVMACDVLW